MTPKGLCQQERADDVLVTVFMVKDGEEDAVELPSVLELSEDCIDAIDYRRRRFRQPGDGGGDFLTGQRTVGIGVSPGGIGNELGVLHDLIEGTP